MKIYAYVLWWLMRHSQDQNQRAWAATHYIDDSGERSAPYTLMGGPVFAQRGRFAFHYEWDRIAALHKVELPIHMKEFARPHGRLAYLSDRQRRELFSDLVKLINNSKVYSLTAVVDNQDFSRYFPPDTFGSHLDAPSMALFWCILLNHLNVKSHERMAPMTYLIARGDDGPQLTDTHNFWKSYEEYREEQYTGPLTFDTPKNVNALQAADMVVWANN